MGGEERRIGHENLIVSGTCNRKGEESVCVCDTSQVRVRVRPGPSSVPCVKYTYMYSLALPLFSHALAAHTPLCL